MSSWRNAEIPRSESDGQHNPGLTQRRQDDGADDHENCLDEVGPDDRGEAPGHGEQGRDGEQDQDGDVDGAVTFKPGGLGDEQSPSVQVSLDSMCEMSSKLSSISTEILVKT